MQVKQPSLLEQRQALCRQLLEQRQSIEQQLDSKTQRDAYPRSVTMRFITGKSATGAKLFKSTAAFVGMNMLSSLTASLLKSKFSGRKRN